MWTIGGEADGHGKPVEYVELGTKGGVIMLPRKDIKACCCPILIDGVNNDELEMAAVTTGS